MVFIFSPSYPLLQCCHRGFRKFHPNGNFRHLEAQKLYQLNSAPLKYSVYAVIQFFFLWTDHDDHEIDKIDNRNLSDEMDLVKRLYGKKRGICYSLYWFQIAWLAVYCTFILIRLRHFVHQFFLSLGPCWSLVSAKNYMEKRWIKSRTHTMYNLQLIAVRNKTQLVGCCCRLFESSLRVF